MNKLKVDNWNITVNGCDQFVARSKDQVIIFQAEYKNGTYFKITSYCDGNRCYTAQRYFYKLIPLVQQFTFELLKNGSLWDYKNNVPALVTYKKDITPYYNECIKKGLPLYGDAEFLHGLFN